MALVTLSNKYRITIPEALRTELGLEAGQEFVAIPKGTVVELVPARPLESARGMLKGANPTAYRDRSEQS